MFYVCRWALMVGLFTLWGCQESKDSTPESVPEEPIKGSFEILPQPQANHYDVRLSWQASQSPKSWALYRKEPHKAMQLLVVLGGDSRSYIDTLAPVGVQSEYVVGTLEPQGFSLRYKYQVSVPKDLELVGTHWLSDLGTKIELKQYRRLFLRKNSRLITDGIPLSLELEALVSEGGVIESFVEDQTASFQFAHRSGYLGRSGGKIWLRALRARGHLTVLTRGENGGIGGRGKPGRRGEKGLSGHAGERGRRYEAHFETGRLRFVGYYCKTKPGNGLVGGQGAAGGRGFTGGKGGNSSPVFLNIEDPSGFTVNIQTFPGKGGLGGDGGLGGAGGFGGEPGPRGCPECPVANVGPIGPVGPVGPSGEVGLSGKAAPICQLLGRARIGDCDAFLEEAN